MKVLIRKKAMSCRGLKARRGPLRIQDTFVTIQYDGELQGWWLVSHFALRKNNNTHGGPNKQAYPITI